jgi:hypothetical protein
MRRAQTDCHVAYYLCPGVQEHQGAIVTSEIRHIADNELTPGSTYVSGNSDYGVDICMWTCACGHSVTRNPSGYGHGKTVCHSGVTGDCPVHICALVLCIYMLLSCAYICSCPVHIYALKHICLRAPGYAEKNIRGVCRGRLKRKWRGEEKQLEKWTHRQPCKQQTAMTPLLMARCTHAQRGAGQTSC